MKVINSQSITDLRITVPNYDGDYIRLKDCDSYTIKVYTDDPNSFILISLNDELKLYGRKMKALKSGSIKFSIEYSVDGYSASVDVTSGYYYQRTENHLCAEDKFPDTNVKHVYAKWNEVQGDPSDSKSLVDYISIQINKNLHTMQWSKLTKELKDEAAKLIGADLSGFTNVLTESEYEVLVETNKVDKDTFYFIYENE